MDRQIKNLTFRWIRHIKSINSSANDEGLVGNQTAKYERFSLPDIIPSGERNGTLFRYASSLWANNVPMTQILKELKATNLTRCQPALTDGEIESIVNSVTGRYEPGTVYEYPDICPDELHRFHHHDKKGNPTSVYDFRILTFLSKKMNILIVGGTPYIYQHGSYVADQNGSQLKTAIRRLIYKPLIKSTTIERVYRLFLTDSELQAEPKEMNSYPAHWINFLNGFYDPVEKRMISHDPKYRSINQIPHEYHPEDEPSGAEAEKWLAFITPEPDDREMLMQYCGYCMTMDTRQQKFLILLGSGGTGKSTLIKILETIIGSDNTSNISLKELTQRFASFGLLGKLLNSCADLELGALEDTSLIKKVLGEDTLRAEQKGKDAVSFKNYAKLIFSTNELPLVLSEKTNGFFRRLLILTMNQQPTTVITDYLERLLGEIDYFIHHFVQALERMYTDGSITESNGSKRAVKTLWNESDTVEAWLEDNCITEFQTDFRLTTTEEVLNHYKVDRTRLYFNYKQWCADTDRTELKQTSFYSSLRLKRFTECKSNGIRYIRGIAFNEETDRRIRADEARRKQDEASRKPAYYRR